MTTYERVTFKPLGAKRAQTVILQNPSSSDLLLSGIEVNREGEEISGQGFDERLRIIDLGLVSKRVPLVMDLHYGLLKTEGEVL